MVAKPWNQAIRKAVGVFKSWLDIYGKFSALVKEDELDDLLSPFQPYVSVIKFL